jgi:hypothetical protein
VLNGYIYVIGGENGGTTQANSQVAKIKSDGTLDTWTPLSDGGSINSNSGVRNAGVVTANGYIYIVGGDFGAVQTTVYYAKPSSSGTISAWTAANSLPAAAQHTAKSAYVANGYLYAIGGASDQGVYYAKLNGDGSIGTWNTAGATLAAARAYYGYSGITVNGYMYVIGGTTTGGGASNTTAYYTSTARVTVGGALDLVGVNGISSGDAASGGQGGIGGELTAGNTTVVGTLAVQGAASFGSDLNVNGNALFKGASFAIVPTSDSATVMAFQIFKADGTTNVLKVDTSTSTLTVVNAVATGNLTVNGHIITGGSVPSKAEGAGIGTGGTCSVSGTDSAGTITINTGSGAWATGDQCVITFSSAYSPTAPRSVIAATSNNYNAVQPYVTSTTTTMTINFAVAAGAAGTYTFNYFNSQ